MNLVNLSDQVYRELETPDKISVASISFWISSNIGKLNMLINTAISVDRNGIFTPNLDSGQKELIKLLYYIYYFTNLVKNSLGSASYSWTEVQEGDSRISQVSKNTIAQSYLMLKRDFQTELDNLVFFYKQNQCVPASYSSYETIYSYCYGYPFYGGFGLVINRKLD